MPTLLDRALKKYDTADLVTQMKARFFFILCLVIPVILLIIISYTAYINIQSPAVGHRVQIRVIGPLIITLIIFILILVLITRGLFSISAYATLSLLNATVWIVMILDRSFAVSRLDTIAYMFAILAMTSLAVIRKGTAIIIYGSANVAALIAFVFVFWNDLNIPRGSMMDYLADNAFSMVSMTIIAFIIFTINRRALDRAKTELTERMRIEEALRESEERYRTLFEYSRDAIMIIEPPSWKFTNANPTFINMLKFADSVEDFKNHTPWDLAPEVQPDGEPSEAKARLMIERAMNIGWSFFELQFVRRTGETFPATVLLSRCQAKDRTFLQATVRDITERKRADEQIRSSLNEKEALLREIHHRVKNNLQIIISLLNLQSGNIKDPNLIQMFNDSTNRIRAMALVHEKLYLSEDLSKIDFTSYIRTIAEELHGNTTISSDRPRLRFETEEVFLAIDQSIPCGLIVNELITNSLKYAFPRGGGGNANEIRVALRVSGTGDVILVVGDNGTGIPDEIDIDNTKSLGLQLVGILIKQLRGTYTLERRNGTVWTITFPGIKPQANA